MMLIHSECEPDLRLSHPKAASSLFEPIPWHIHTLKPCYNLPWRWLRQRRRLRAFCPRGALNPPSLRPSSTLSSFSVDSFKANHEPPPTPHLTRSGPNHVRAKCASPLPLQAVSLYQHYRGFRKELGDASALDVVTETHVDSPCGIETPLTFVYISADAVRNNEDVLKPHCRYMRMSGMNRGGYFQYLLFVCFLPPHLFFFFFNDSHVWPHIKHWNYFSVENLNCTVLFKGI